jgi:hypothetical protein
MDVVGEAVEKHAGEPLGAEYGRPLVERQIARDQGAASFVARALRKNRAPAPSATTTNALCGILSTIIALLLFWIFNIIELYY